MQLMYETGTEFVIFGRLFLSVFTFLPPGFIYIIIFLINIHFMCLNAVSKRVNVRPTTDLILDTFFLGEENYSYLQVI